MSGLNDAPLLWQLALRQAMEHTGGTSSLLDENFLTRKDTQKQLIGVMTTHDDDCCIAGHPALIRRIHQSLGQRLGTMTEQVPPMLHVGVQYERLVGGSDFLHQASFAKELKPIAIDKVRYVGTGLWNRDGIGREPAMVGGWFAGPAPEGRAAFVDRFAKAYGRPPHGLASLAYDATALAAVLG